MNRRQKLKRARPTFSKTNLLVIAMDNKWTLTYPIYSKFELGVWYRYDQKGIYKLP